MSNLKPVGKHFSAGSHDDAMLVVSDQVVHACKKNGIDLGETTADGEFA